MDDQFEGRCLGGAVACTAPADEAHFPVERSPWLYLGDA
jgi:hypothetical protein